MPKRDNTRDHRMVINSLLSTSPQTRRQLSKSTGFEIATLCRILYDAINHNKTIIVSHYAPCSTTGVNVMHFKLRNVGKGAK